MLSERNEERKEGVGGRGRKGESGEKKRRRKERRRTKGRKRRRKENAERFISPLWVMQGNQQMWLHRSNSVSVWLSLGLFVKVSSM